MKLIAQRTIMHDNVVYEAGDSLVVSDEQAGVLLECGAAVAAQGSDDAGADADDEGKKAARQRRQ